MQLILWPAVITLAITLLRLTGELQHWSKTFFNSEPGGGGALVGISWLPFVLGPYFAWKLVKSGKGPESAGKAALLALAGLAVAIGSFFVASKLGIGAVLAAFFVALGAGFIPWKAWPELGRTLMTYGFAARIPVVIVMLFAILGKWGTHYDVLPPDAPPNLLAMGPVGQWFFIGLVPQLTIWIGQTMLIGTLIGAIVVALAKPKAGA